MVEKCQEQPTLSWTISQKMVLKKNTQKVKVYGAVSIGIKPLEKNSNLPIKHSFPPAIVEVQFLINLEIRSF